MSSGGWSLCRRMPSGAPRFSSSSRCALHWSRLTITGPSAGISAAPLASIKELVASSPFLTRAILSRLAFVAVDGVLERVDADASIRVEKTLVLLANDEIRVDDLANRRRYLGLWQPGTEP